MIVHCDKDISKSALLLNVLLAVQAVCKNFNTFKEPDCKKQQN